MDQQTKIIVHDDSHARAILKAEMRRFYDYYSAQLDKAQQKLKKASSLKRQYLILKEFFKRGLKGYIIWEEEVVQGHSRRKNWLCLYLDLNISKILSNKDYPPTIYISIVSIDSKKPRIDRPRPYLAISAHTLERIVRREQLHSVPKILNFLGGLLFNLAGTYCKKFEDFVFIYINGYPVCKYMENRVLLVKTFVSSSWWSRHQVAKLGSLANHLKHLDDEMWVRVSVEEFNSSRWIDPQSLRPDQFYHLDNQIEHLYDEISSPAPKRV